MNNTNDKKEDNDDVVFSNEEEESSPQVVIKKLRAKLKECEEKKEEYLTGWQKERAESVNLRKKVEEEKKDFAKFANEKLVRDILPTLDSLDMALANEDALINIPKEWTKGLERIYVQLLSALEESGLKRISSSDEKLDPATCEALALIPVENEAKDGIVLEVMQPGYSFHGKVVRTAKVKVGDYKKEN